MPLRSNPIALSAAGYGPEDVPDSQAHALGERAVFPYVDYDRAREADGVGRTFCLCPEYTGQVAASPLFWEPRS